MIRMLVLVLIVATIVAAVTKNKTRERAIKVTRFAEIAIYVIVGVGILCLILLI